MQVPTWTEEEVAEIRSHYSQMGPAGMERAGMCGGKSRKAIGNKAKKLGITVDPQVMQKIREEMMQRIHTDRLGLPPSRGGRIAKKKRHSAYRPPEPRYTSVWSYAAGERA